MASRRDLHQEEITEQAPPGALLSGEELPRGPSTAVCLVEVADGQGGGGRDEQQVGALDGSAKLLGQADVDHVEGIVGQACDEEQLAAVEDEVGRAHPGVGEAPGGLVELRQGQGQVASQGRDGTQCVEGVDALEVLPEQIEQLPGPLRVGQGTAQCSPGLVNASPVEERARLPELIAVLAKHDDRTTEVLEGGVVLAEVETGVGTAEQDAGVEQPTGLLLRAIELGEPRPAATRSDQGGAEGCADIDGPVGDLRGLRLAQGLPQDPQRGRSVAAIPVDDPGRLVGVGGHLGAGGVGKKGRGADQRLAGLGQGQRKQALAVSLLVVR